MRFLIAGAGAVGGFVGARLTDAGQDVTVLVRPHRVAELRENGLRVTGPAGTRTARPSVVTADQLTPGYDAIVLATKSADLASRARATGTATPLIDLAVLALRIHNRRLSR